MKKLVLLVVLALTPTAYADGSGSSANGSAATEAGSASISSGSGSAIAPTSPAPAPAAPAVHNPIESPSDYVDDVALAKKAGWPVLILVLVFGLCEALAWAGRGVPFLHWLGTGRVSSVIAGAVSVTTAMIAAIAAKATPTSVLMAGVSAVLLWAHPSAADVAAAKAKAAAEAPPVPPA